MNHFSRLMLLSFLIIGVFTSCSTFSSRLQQDTKLLIEYALYDFPFPLTSRIVEKETVILQRRSARLKKNIKIGEKIISEDIEFLRPCPKNAAPIYDIHKIYNKISTINLSKNDYITLSQFKKILRKK